MWNIWRTCKLHHWKRVSGMSTPVPLFRHSSIQGSTSSFLHSEMLQTTCKRTSRYDNVQICSVWTLQYRDVHTMIEYPSISETKLQYSSVGNFFLWRCGPTRAMASSFLMFLDHTQRRTIDGRTPLDEWSARRRDLYLTTHNTHHKYPCHRWDSNPRSQQASGRRPTP